MAQVIYIDRDERRYVAEVEHGTNLMQAAVDHLVPKILGDCGGAAACATCHVHVDPAWSERVGPASELEVDLLDGLLDTQPNSRLACQITMNERLDGLVLRLTEQQF